MKKIANLEKLRRANRRVQTLFRTSGATVDQAAALWNAAASDFCRELDEELKAINGHPNLGAHDATV